MVGPKSTQTRVVGKITDEMCIPTSYFQVMGFLWKTCYIIIMNNELLIFVMHFQCLGHQLVRLRLDEATWMQQLYCHTVFQASFQALHKQSSCIQAYAVALALQTSKKTSHTMWWWMGYVMSTFFTCVHILSKHTTPTRTTCGSQCLKIDWSTPKCRSHFQGNVSMLSMSSATNKSWKWTLYSNTNSTEITQKRQLTELVV